MFSLCAWEADYGSTNATGISEIQSVYSNITV